MDKIKNDFYIYCHIFPNNKKYIGVSHQKPERRFRNGKGYKGQYVYKAIKKFGWNNIKYIILSKNLSWKEAQEEEKKYILKFKTNEIEYGYNISIGQQPKEEIKRKYYKTSGMTGKHHSEKTKEKMSIARIGKKMNIKTIIKKSKAVIQYDKKMNMINEYYGITEASKKTNINISNISKCCKNQRKTAGGYIWKFKGGNNYATN